jgi:glycosyltransferase involved in cell wall biosynthesis
MINNKIITVVLPAYNTSKTLEITYSEIPFNIVDNVILVDDCSNDNTIEVAASIGIKEIIVHNINQGYGGNQKSCYKRAIELKSDIVIMLHPDYQYTPKLIHSMSYLIANGVYDVVLGSRILGREEPSLGECHDTSIFNRFLTLSQNILMRQKLK